MISSFLPLVTGATSDESYCSLRSDRPPEVHGGATPHWPREIKSSEKERNAGIGFGLYAAGFINI